MIQVLFVFNDWGLLVLRVVLGLILVARGLPKLVHLSKSSKSFKKTGFRSGKLWMFLAGVLGVFVILGFLTQISSFLVALIFLVRIRRFRKETFGKWENDLLILAVAVLLATSGPGRFSLDEVINWILY